MELNALRNRTDLDEIALQADRDNDGKHPSDLFRLILDRLSPPEPEVDEATVWTRKVLHAEYQITAYATGEMDDRAQFINARQVLSELIASKDAEIEKARKWAREQHKLADEYASELAAQMVREMRVKSLSLYSDEMVPIARRYIDKALTAQADEIERLRARLEITDEITERYDGIACRDETIRLLEQKIAALKAAQEVKHV